MKSFLRSFFQTSEIGYLLLFPFARVYYFFLHKKYLSPEKFTRKRFKKNLGYELNLENPITLNEKINWLKLNYNNPIGSKLADKYEVRKYIEEKIGNEYLIPLAFVTSNPKDIVPKNLPDYPIIIKTNHDSSGGIVVKDKNESVNWKEIQLRLRKNMSQNYYWDNRELVYKDIKPLIIVEKLLDDGTGSFPADYKLHCFNGNVEMISVDVARGSKEHFRNWYNKEWEKQPYQWSKMLKNSSNKNSRDIEKPKCLDKMIELSESLSKEFKYLRVDWYLIGNKLYFGELTLYHIGGTGPFKPDSWDAKLGEKLNIKDQ